MSDYISRLKKDIYHKASVARFLDGFRLKLLYNDVFERCSDDEKDIIYREILSIEQNNNSAGDTGFKPSLAELWKESKDFIFPSPKFFVDVHLYLSLRTASLKAVTGTSYLFCRYESDIFNDFTGSLAYKQLYNESVILRVLVSEMQQDYAYACGETDYKSARLVRYLSNEDVVHAVSSN